MQITFGGCLLGDIFVKQQQPFLTMVMIHEVLLVVSLLLAAHVPSVVPLCSGQSSPLFAIHPFFHWSCKSQYSYCYQRTAYPVTLTTALSLHCRSLCLCTPLLVATVLSMYARHNLPFMLFTPSLVIQVPVFPLLLAHCLPRNAYCTVFALPFYSPVYSPVKIKIELIIGLSPCTGREASTVYPYPAARPRGCVNWFGSTVQ